MLFWGCFRGPLIRASKLVRSDYGFFVSWHGNQMCYFPFKIECFSVISLGSLVKSRFKIRFRERQSSLLGANRITRFYFWEVIIEYAKFAGWNRWTVGLTSTSNDYRQQISTPVGSNIQLGCLGISVIYLRHRINQSQLSGTKHN